MGCGDAAANTEDDLFDVAAACFTEGVRSLSCPLLC
jgi:hypothetical protein